MATERYARGKSKQPELCVISNDDGGVEVWLNTGVTDYDGLCIGTGDTRDAAVGDAVAALEWLTEALQRPRA